MLRTSFSHFDFVNMKISRHSNLSSCVTIGRQNLDIRLCSSIFGNNLVYRTGRLVGKVGSLRLAKDVLNTLSYNMAVQGAPAYSLCYNLNNSRDVFLLHS